VIGELGEGNFSRIVHVRHKETHEEFALKIIDKVQVRALI
jgi:hypothetical protein